VSTEDHLLNHKGLLLCALPPLRYVSTGSLTKPSAKTIGSAVEVILPRSSANDITGVFLRKKDEDEAKAECWTGRHVRRNRTKSCITNVGQ
jgi:hypothetical protein